GINNHMGSRFTAHEGKLAVVLAELSRRGLMFLDSRTTPATKGPELATRYHLPLVSRDVFLDDDQSPRAVQAMLAKVEEVARHHGTAVAIGHPHDVTLTALERWLPTLAAKGFTLVPLTSVIAPPPGGS
ncbi:divergent polysaccharide deacetylase family protein, partial [Azospirillum sp. B4]|uniref:divergent polysaccharide deacetylase family protein n=1 Tax=Azospirillum sp. B4 TaxID=95605 RepID=UPI0005C89A66